MPQQAKADLRPVFESPVFQDIISNAIIAAFNRYPARDDIEHRQSANLSAREAINQFVSDLYTEVNALTTEETEEQYN